MKEPDPIQLKAFYEKQEGAAYASGHGDCWEMWVELNNRIIERDKRIEELEAQIAEMREDIRHACGSTDGDDIRNQLSEYLPGRGE